MNRRLHSNFRSSLAARSLAVACLVLAVAFHLPAQVTNEPSPSKSIASDLATNDLNQAEDAMSDTDISGAAEDMTANEPADTNAPAMSNAPVAAPGPDARARRLNRDRQNRSRRAAQYAPSSQSATNTVGASLDYTAFRLVADRNIFDPNRFPHNTAARPQPKTVEAFTLVGTMSYEKGDFAFFDGTSSDYKKVLKPSESIAGYRVLEVSPDSVKLARGTNELVLAVGTQLRRQDDGLWVPGPASGAYAAAPSNSTSTIQTGAAGTPGGDDEVLKRLLQRHEKD